MFRSKIRAILYRIFMPMAYFPVRLLRLLIHLFYPFLFWISKIPQYQIIHVWYDWFLMIPFFVIDILGLPEFYEVMNELINWNIRDLNSHEIQMINQVFNFNIPIEFIRVHAGNSIAKKLSIAYVSFRQINYFDRLSNDVFIHEMVHVWQYNVFGAVYIYHAWKAQMSEEGYNYGKAAELIVQLKKGKLFHEFNFEQQADIIQDYYCSFNFPSFELDSEDFLAYRSYQDEMNSII